MTSSIIIMQRPRLGNCITCLSHFLPFADQFELDVYFPDFAKFLPIFRGLGKYPHFCYRGAEKQFSAEHPLQPSIVSSIREKIPSYEKIPIEVRRAMIEPEFKQLGFDTEDSKIGLINAPIQSKTILESPNVVEFVLKNSVTAFWVGFQFSSTQQRELTQILSIDQTMAANVETKYNVFSDRTIPVIGIHIRRGDYAFWKNGDYFYSLEHYANTIQLIAKKFNNRCTFFVATDEPISAEIFLEQKVAIGGKSVNEDFAGLSLCDYVVGPPSTFSEHAARMGRGRRLRLTKDGLDLSLFDTNKFVSQELLRVSSETSFIQ